MATQSQLDKLKETSELFRKIDPNKLMRSNLGDASLVSSFGQRFEDLNKKLTFILDYAPDVSDNDIKSTTAAYKDLYEQFNGQTNKSDVQYLQDKERFLEEVGAKYETILQYWPVFTIAALEKRGFLRDEGFIEEYKRTITAMKKESQKIIEETQNKAKQIEEQARKTATHVSVKDAQEQFKEAEKYHRNSVILWSVFSATSILAFIGVAYYLTQINLKEEWNEWKWHIVYYTAIRITILTAFGAIAAFCLRILRAHMHMRQHNLHRQRLANSMAAFVESALTPEQRDHILAQLVDAIATFGSSGLLHKEDDSIYSPKMTIDAITRNLIPPKS